MRRIFLATITLVQLAGCSGIQVNQDYAPGTRLDALQTFQWTTDTQPATGDLRIDNPLRDARIRAAVERVLAGKGLTRSQDGTADFGIRYQYSLRQKIESSGASSGIGFGFGRYSRHAGIAIGTGDSIREYDEVSLVIDFLEKDSEKLLWRGTGTQRFRQYDDPVKAESDINNLVEKILEQFPPRP